MPFTANLSKQNAIFQGSARCTAPLLVILIFLGAPLYGQGVVTYKVKNDFDGAYHQLVQSIMSNNMELLNSKSFDKEVAVDTVERAKLIVFEDPDLVRDLMNCDVTVSFELPFRILVWEEHDHVYFSFKDPSALLRNYMVNECSEQVKAWSRLNVKIVNDALKQSEAGQ